MQLNGPYTFIQLFAFISIVDVRSVNSIVVVVVTILSRFANIAVVLLFDRKICSCVCVWFSTNCSTRALTFIIIFVGNDSWCSTKQKFHIFFCSCSIVSLRLETIFYFININRLYAMHSTVLLIFS